MSNSNININIGVNAQTANAEEGFRTLGTNFDAIREKAERTTSDIGRQSTTMWDNLEVASNQAAERLNSQAERIRERQQAAQEAFDNGTLSQQGFDRISSTLDDENERIIQSQEDLAEALNQLRAQIEEWDDNNIGNGSSDSDNGVGDRTRRTNTGIQSVTGQVANSLGAGDVYNPISQTINSFQSSLTSGLGVGVASLAATSVLLAAAAAKLIQAGDQLERSTNKLNSIVDIGDRDSFLNRVGGAQEIQDLGVSISEFQERAFALAQQRGSFQNVELYERNNLMAEKAFGLSDNALLNADKFSRQDNGMSSSAFLMDFVQKAKQENLFRMDEDNYSLLQEKLGQMVSLLETQKSNSEKVDSNLAANLLIFGGKVGGSFADDRAAGNFNTIDSSIRNPNNDFKKAFTFNALRNKYREESLFGLMEKQEDGMQNLDAILSEISDDGSDKYFMNIMAYTGLSAQKSRTLGQALRSDPKLLKTLNTSQDPEALSKFLDSKGRDVVDRAKQNAATIDTIKAGITSFFQDAGKPILDFFSGKSTTPKPPEPTDNTPKTNKYTQFKNK